MEGANDFHRDGDTARLRDLGVANVDIADAKLAEHQRRFFMTWGGLVLPFVFSRAEIRQIVGVVFV